VALADILKTIIKPAKRTSADLRADLAKIDLQALEAVVDALERKRRDLLLRGTDAEMAAITGELSAANLEAERGQAAVDELKLRLIPEAEAREQAAALDAKVAEARRLQRRLIEQFVAFDDLAAKLAEQRDDLEATQRQLEAANSYLGEQGRGDLRQPTPRQLLDAQGVAQDTMPRTSEWAMPGYFPLPGRRPFGLAKQLLEETGRG